MANSESISLHIAGMHCAACVGRVEKALARVPGMLKAEVLLTDQRAQLELQAGWQAGHLVQAITEAGYELPLSQATLAVDGLIETVQLPRLEAALRAVPGVLEVAVNLAQSSVRLQALPSTPAAALLAAARDAGFKAVLQPLQGDADPLAAEAAALRRDLVVALAGTLPLLAPMLAMPLGLHLHLPPLWQALLAALVLLLPGRRLLRGAWSGLRARAPGMDLLVSIGSWSAFALSCWLWARGASGMALYFESAAAIVCFVLLGRWLEGRAKHATGSAVRGLQALMPALAEVQLNGQWKAIPLAELLPGQRVRVRPGQRLPCDGRVEAGRSHINLAHLTGEPLPQAVEAGDFVQAAALNLDGVLELSATQTAAASSLGQLVRLVETAQASKASIQRLADRVAARFVPAVLGIALLTLLGWGLAGHWDTGLLNAVAVLVVACPCALGLATPTAVVVGIGQAAKLGLLVRDAQALELLASVQRIAFDKTGTLTRGRPQLLQVEPVASASSGANRLQLQGLAAALAQASNHPLSRALREAQGELPLPEAKFQREHAGLGLEAEVEGQRLLLGSSRLMAERGIATIAMERSAAAQAAQGRSVSWLASLSPQPQLLALLAFGDEPRADAKEALATLRALGLKLSLLSGDRPEAALAMAQRLGIDDPDAVFGGLLPADKLSSLHAWRAQGERVAFVGDGLNDAPALAAADVGIAIGGDQGNDVSRHAAGLTLMRPQLARLPQAVRLARATLRTIKQNLAWAFGFNLLMIPLAIAGQLPPALAALAMAGSSLMVVGNALRLRRWS